MITYSLYRLDTGLFTGVTVSVPAAAIHDNTPPGCGAMAGEYDPRLECVDLVSGEIAEREFTPEPPPTVEAQRARAYPPLVDQVAALIKGGAELEAMRAQVQAVKTKYPKPKE